MSKLIYLIGLPGSGKSEFAKELAKKERAKILSTDELRGELFFNESRQKKTGLLYQQLFKRAELLLSESRNVLIDATNIERERRIKALKKLNASHKECYYIDTPYELCLEQNQNRKRKVDERIISKMRKSFDFPFINEGWDAVKIVHKENPYQITKEVFIDLLRNEVSYENLFEHLNQVPIFRNMYQFDQENPYHSLKLCEHTYTVLEYINEMYEEDDRFLMQVVALFHDIGKPFCKTYKKAKGYYSYYGHEKVSAQIACHFLKQLNFDDSFIHQAVQLIEMHMKITYGGDEGANEIYHLLGDELLWKLYFFREADLFAK